MIRVLVVDDSPTQRLLIHRVLESDPAIAVVGEAKNGVEAIELRDRLHPDIVTMDIQMPKMDGFEAIRRIMSESPCPIIVLTTSDSDTRFNTSFHALKAGALTVLRKPCGPVESDAKARQLIFQVKTMAGVKVVGRRRNVDVPPATEPRIEWKPPPEPPAGVCPDVIAIGASTGGPPALQRILGGLSAEDLPPILVVQHISPGFLEGFAHWLNETITLHVKPAEAGEIVSPGIAYLAPDGCHLQVTSGGRIVLQASPPIDGHIPSVTALFDSVADSYGASAVGILLTGMGRDGAAGLLKIKAMGAYTIVQDEASSVVYGMGREAVALGAASEILPLDRIAARVSTLIRGRRGAR